MYLEVRVVPNAKKFSVSVKENLIKIYVQAKAENNEANKELVQELTKLIGKKALLVKGAKSKRKVIEVEGEENEVLGKIQEIAQKN